LGCKTFSDILFKMFQLTEVSRKFNECLLAFQCFQKDTEKFGQFFHRVLLAMLEEAKSSIREGRSLLHFLNCAFGSLEIDLVRKQVQGLVSLHVWHCIAEVGEKEKT